MSLLQMARRPVRVAPALVALLALVSLRPLAAQEEPHELVVEGAGIGLRGARYQLPSEPLPPILPAAVALVVRNPNGSFAAEDVRLRLSVFGVDDQRIHLGSSDDSPDGQRELIDVPQILPRERRALVLEALIAQDQLPVARVEAEVVSVARWLAVRDVPLLEVWGVRGHPESHGDTREGPVYRPIATGTLISPFDTALDDVAIVGIVYDRTGNIAGGSLRRLPHVGPFGIVIVGTAVLIYGTDIRSRTAVGASWARVEVFATYPWIDLTPYRR